MMYKLVPLDNKATPLDQYHIEKFENQYNDVDKRYNVRKPNAIRSIKHELQMVMITLGYEFQEI